MHKITIHSSATPPTMNITARDIRQWHKARGWSDIGYHWIITRDGKLEAGRPMTKAGAHVKGHNTNNIGICLVGGTSPSGKPENNFTNPQWQTLQSSITLLSTIYNITPTKVYGHKDLNPNTACPSFNVKAWLNTHF
ncbi:lysozyme [Vibrio astriarenae]|uniref:Lysozyme n=1 Tax=Vibrio astriarenae TaxID=1481923 RepID=A0A7Z2T509_9VIBR|nr:N-acetylmuramoyl-L-alanine amidase [Vibrio astriarenae]QIA64452.1 lysozyme [Vibrio astriarenae]